MKVEMDFKTTYGTQFCEKKIPERPVLRGKTQEFKDPLFEPFRPHLYFEQLPPDEKDCTENLYEFGDRFLKGKAGIKKTHFTEPVREDVVRDVLATQGMSIYKSDYVAYGIQESENLLSQPLKSERDGRDERDKEDISRVMHRIAKGFQLPEGWIIPETTQRYDFRDPVLLNPKAHVRRIQKRPMEELKVLDLPTGASEYEDMIGRLGGIITREHMYGEIIRPDCKCVGLLTSKNT